MSHKAPVPNDPIHRASTGTLLANEGDQLAGGFWERSVYLGPDDFVYHIAVVERPAGLDKSIVGKRTIGEYLRWVDGLFTPGSVPSPENGIHFRAARKLRELL
jgi:hypothetical protein